MTAAGIHDHPTYKLGLRPPSNKPALYLDDVLTGAVPAHPTTADHFGKFSFGLYGNDEYGDCGPTSVANLVRLVTGGLLGTEVQPSQADVFDLYRRSGNPNFDPTTDADDNGVDMQTMLEALTKGGIGDGKGGLIKSVAFAKVAIDDAEIEAAISIFGGVLFGVDLQTAQQAQTDAVPPKWDYKKSGEWGGHAIVAGSYDSTGDVDVESWATRVQTTAAFRRNQLQEAWVVVWQWNLDDQAFQAGVDVAQLAADYMALTGKVLPVPTPPKPAPTPAPSPTPTPTPTPTPAPTPSPAPTSADAQLWSSVEHWAVDERHVGDNKKAALAVQAWAKSKNL